MPREIIPKAVLRKMVSSYFLDALYDLEQTWLGILPPTEFSKFAKASRAKAGQRIQDTLEFLDEAYAREAALDTEAEERISEPGA